MKLKKNSTHQLTSEYKHPWYDHIRSANEAVPPRPPSPEAVKKAQFVDKTYSWKGE